MALAIKGSGAFLRAVCGSWWRCSVRSALLLLWEWPSVFCLWNRLILFLHLILFHFFKTCLFHPKPKSTPDCLYGSYVSPTARLSPSSHSTEDRSLFGSEPLNYLPSSIPFMFTLNISLDMYESYQTYSKFFVKTERQESYQNQCMRPKQPTHQTKTKQKIDEVNI